MNGVEENACDRDGSYSEPLLKFSAAFKFIGSEHRLRIVGLVSFLFFDIYCPIQEHKILPSFLRHQEDH